MCASADPSRRGLLRRLRSDRQGTAAVEFALTLPLLALLIYLVIETARLMFAWNTLQLGADEAARWASVRPAAAVGQVQAVGEGFNTGLDPDRLTVSVVREIGGAGEPDAVAVTGIYRFRLLMPGLVEAARDITLTARSRMPVIGS